VASSAVADFAAACLSLNPAQVAFSSARARLEAHTGHSVARSGTTAPHLGQFMVKRDPTPQRRSSTNWGRQASACPYCEFLHYRTDGHPHWPWICRERALVQPQSFLNTAVRRHRNSVVSPGSGPAAYMILLPSPEKFRKGNFNRPSLSVTMDEIP